MAHFAVDTDGHDVQVGMSAHADHHTHHQQTEAEAECLLECAKQDGNSCGSVAVGHCQSSATQSEIADEVIVLLSEDVSFDHADTVAPRRMPEQEPPPPRF
ncbi:MAG: hypothetical protein VW405_20625 [Rhodospirillaceae bacterium]